MPSRHSPPLGPKRLRPAARPLTRAACAPLWPRCAAARAAHTSGEKRLRTLLCRTTEWSDPGTREASAAAAEAAGHADLATALRTRNAAALRKRHFFWLCRAWHLRCDVWVHHSKRGFTLMAGSAAPEPADATHQAADQPAVRARRRKESPAVSREPSGPLATGTERAVAAVRAELSGPVASWLSAVMTPSLMAAAASEPYAPLTTLDLTVRARAGAAATRGPRWVCPHVTAWSGQ
jgi:hypothetical protein